MKIVHGETSPPEMLIGSYRQKDERRTGKAFKITPQGLARWVEAYGYGPLSGP
jgi:hypothetical protein